MTTFKDRIELLTFGYVRQIQTGVGQYFIIPHDIIQLCLTYFAINVIHSLTYFDTILTGGDLHEKKVSNDHVLLIKNMLNMNTNKNERHILVDSYIQNTFEAFAQNKTQITLDLGQLYEFTNEEIIDLILYPLNRRKQQTEECMRVESD
eukprot:277103_1